jgi:hypothetical protein|nr:MAG TPA: hypothetical protein [Caudoviricetes sp.]
MKQILYLIGIIAIVFIPLEVLNQTSKHKSKEK